MFEIDGVQYTEADVRQLASAANLSFEDYLIDSGAMKLSYAPVSKIREAQDK